MRAVLVTLLLIAAPAFAGEHREAIMDLLNAHEEMHPERFTELGDGIDVELMAIARDEEVPLSRRARAVTALGGFKTDDVRQFLDAHLETATHAGILRRKAAWSLAKGWGDGALPILEKALADDDPQLRMATARALGKVDGGQGLLKARLDSESTPSVREVILAELGGR